MNILTRSVSCIYRNTQYHTTPHIIQHTAYHTPYMASVNHVRLQSAAIDVVERGTTQNNGTRLTPMGAIVILATCHIQVSKFHISVVRALNENGVLTRFNTVLERYNGRSVVAKCDSCGVQISGEVYGYGPGVAGSEMDFCTTCVGEVPRATFPGAPPRSRLPFPESPPFPQQPFAYRPPRDSEINVKIMPHDGLIHAASINANDIGGPRPVQLQVEPPHALDMSHLSLNGDSGNAGGCVQE